MYLILTKTLGAALSLPKCGVVTLHRGTVLLLTVHCTILKQTVMIISPHVIYYMNKIYKYKIQFNLVIAVPSKLVNLLKHSGLLNFAFVSKKLELLKLNV